MGLFLFLRRPAFTLIEITLVMIVIVVFVSTYSFFSASFVKRERLIDAFEQLKSHISLQQQRARTAYLNDSWSIMFDIPTNSYTLFKGEAFLARDQAFDQKITLNSAVSFQEVPLNSMISFLKPYGYLTNPVTITLKNTQGFTKRLYINTLGILSSDQPLPVYVPPVPQDPLIVPTLYTVEFSSKADSNLYKGSAGTNYGSDSSIWVQTWFYFYHRRGIISFDLSTIPSDAVVKSAVLTLYLVNTHGTERNYGLYKTQQIPARDFVEGQVSWNNYKSGKTWTNPGGDMELIATEIKKAGSWPGTPYAVTFNVIADVQNFVLDSSQNFGWIIKDENEGGTAQYYVQFASKEHGTAAYRPVLQVEYEK